MKFVDEFRDADVAKQLVDQIRQTVSRRWVLMDVCGGQTHNLLRYGIEEALGDCIEIIHGPGCPVCVTPIESIDFSQQLSLRPGVILASFGDMLRVPGSRESLLEVRARGGRLKIVYSPLDALQLAEQGRDEEIVFFAVGFETTAPATALAVLQAQSRHLSNFSVLSAHVRVLPAMEALLSSPDNRVQGFLAAGHVCTITGFEQYVELAARFQVPMTITGFEPVDLLQGILATVRQLELGKTSVTNCYARSARRQGNTAAISTVDRVYEVRDCAWRGFGVIRQGGLGLRKEFGQFDAERRHRFEFNLPLAEPTLCLGAEVMSGRIKPPECPYYSSSCTPESPLGAPMVSSEGACAAYIRYSHAAPKTS